jgi:hypothetical protein
MLDLFPDLTDAAESAHAGRLRAVRLSADWDEDEAPDPEAAREARIRAFLDARHKYTRAELEALRPLVLRLSLLSDAEALQLGWERYGGRRGGKGWKHTETGRVVYQEKMPGERGKKQEQAAPAKGLAEAKPEPKPAAKPEAPPKPAPRPKPKVAPKPRAPKPAPQPKPTRPTVQEVAARVQGMLLGRHPITPQHVEQLAQTLLGMTVRDIQTVKQALGLKASGLKAQLARKVAQRALAAIKAPSGEKPPAPAAQPVPAFTPAASPTEARPAEATPPATPAPQPSGQQPAAEQVSPVAESPTRLRRGKTEAPVFTATRGGQKVYLRPFGPDRQRELRNEMAARQAASLLGMPTSDLRLERSSLPGIGEGEVAVSPEVGPPLAVVARRRGGLRGSVPDADVSRALTFDFVVGNTDSNLGNYLVDRRTGRLVGHDYELAFGALEPMETMSLNDLLGQHVREQGGDPTEARYRMPLDREVLHKAAAHRGQLLQAAKSAGANDHALRMMAARLDTATRLATLPDPRVVDLIQGEHDRTYWRQRLFGQPEAAAKAPEPPAPKPPAEATPPAQPPAPPAEKYLADLELEDHATAAGYRNFDAFAHAAFGLDAAARRHGVSPERFHTDRRTARLADDIQEFRERTNKPIAAKLRGGESLTPDEQRQVDAVNHEARAAALPVPAEAYRKVNFPTDLKPGDVVSDPAPLFVGFRKSIVGNIDAGKGQKLWVIHADAGTPMLYVNGPEPYLESVIPSGASLRVEGVQGDTVTLRYAAPGAAPTPAGAGPAGKPAAAAPQAAPQPAGTLADGRRVSFVATPEEDPP